MDRLFGDVGFGKTEVVMRAAFKAVNDGKQAAILVPTLVLPISTIWILKSVLEIMPLKQMNPVVLEVKRAEWDYWKSSCAGVLIYYWVLTAHCLKMLSFLDLGLLGTDEEQRFYVKHKEKLKELKAILMSLL